MRYAELAFLLLLLAYHTALLVPRRQRFFPANYLVFLAGMALAWNLGLEGLRWQTLPGIALLLVDLAVLFPTLRTLRGRTRGSGVGAIATDVLRTLVASVAFFLAVGTAVLSIAFPLPSVALTGGLPPAVRTVRFPPTAEQPGLEVWIWYPAAGDTRPAPRPQADAAEWQRLQVEGGLPVFWQSYLAHLPTNLIRGGRLASAGTRYPVVYVALPPGRRAVEYGYWFEDLASRGLMVVAGGPVPPPLPSPSPFDWTAVVAELSRPLFQPDLWLEPDAQRVSSTQATDLRWLGATQAVLKQLDQEPGDLLFQAIDWGHQALWTAGPGPGLAADRRVSLGLRGQWHLDAPGPAVSNDRHQLWVTGAPGLTGLGKDQWSLTVPRWTPADGTDSSYLRPYLAVVGLKSQADAGFHGALREYQAAFFQYLFWGSGGTTAFGQIVPEVPGLVLSGP